MSYLLPIAAIIFLLWAKSKIPAWRGALGERTVNRFLNRLNLQEYKILSDVMLPSEGKTQTTQIDHIVVSRYGIFCIETKNYSGWIFGSARDEMWTQVIYRHKERFYNPLRQNFAHTKAIESVIRLLYPKVPVVGFVIFPSADKLKISGTDNVGYTCDVLSKIKGYTTQVIEYEDRDKIFEILTKTNIVNKESRKAHTRETRALKGDV
jgi:hypothetical protein